MHDLKATLMTTNKNKRVQTKTEVIMMLEYAAHNFFFDAAEQS